MRVYQQSSTNPLTPRTIEIFELDVAQRSLTRTGQIESPVQTLVSLSRDGTTMRFAFPKELRNAVRQLDEVSMLIHGPADSMTLGRVSRWCEEHDVLPQTLTLGQRNLEDVFLELTGRGLS